MPCQFARKRGKLIAGSKQIAAGEVRRLQASLTNVNSQLEELNVTSQAKIAQLTEDRDEARADLCTVSLCVICLRSIVNALHTTEQRTQF